MAAVQVVGLAEFRRDLKGLDNAARWDRELAIEQRKIGSVVAGRSRFEAAGMGGVQRHFASAITGGGGATGARVRINSARRPGADGAFWGAKQFAQFDPWIGNTWDAWKGEGPYAIAPTVASMADEIEQMYAEGIQRVALAASSYWTATF